MSGLSEERGREGKREGGREGGREGERGKIEPCGTYLTIEKKAESEL